MQFSELVLTSAEVASTRARRKKITALGGLLRRVSADELPIVVRFLSGELTQGRVGLGPATVRAALDAARSVSAVPPADRPELLHVDAALGEIAKIAGSGSNTRRRMALATLFERLDDAGRDFLARLILGEVRHGALEGLMVEAIAAASGVPATAVRRGVMLTGDLSHVAAVVADEGSGGLAQISLRLFRPIQPMLAETAENPQAAIEQLGQAALEYKLDGVRVQVHKDADEVRVYTRQLNEITNRVPEVVEAAHRLRTSQTILDGEVLALRPDGRPHPFQTTMRRLGRQRDVEQLRDSLPLSVVFFDCLLLDRQELIDRSAAERHLALTDCVPEQHRVPRLVTGDVSSANRFLEQAIAAGHEGIMAKSDLDAYEAGGRGRSWLKIKPSHTLDLVVLAAEWGSGRRRGWLSNLHLGARVGGNQFAMVGKTFKGLTDETLAWQSEQLLRLETGRDQHVVFVRPELVVEIAFNDVQRSPHYASGVALRFARVKRYRTDKSAGEADTLEQFGVAAGLIGMGESGKKTPGVFWGHRRFAELPKQPKSPCGPYLRISLSARFIHGVPGLGVIQRLTVFGLEIAAIEVIDHSDRV